MGGHGHPRTPPSYAPGVSMIMFYKNIIMGGKGNGVPVDGVFLNFDFKKS